MNNKKRQEFRDGACLFLLFGIGFMLMSRSCSVSKMAMNYISKNDSGWFWIPSGNIAVVLVGFGIFLIGVVMFFFDLIKRRDEATQGQHKLHCQKRSCSTL